MDLAKLRTRRSVLKRTKSRPDLPKLGLYLEALGGTAQRKVLDAEKKEHVITDKVLLSYYKVVTGSEAEALLAEHWPDVKAD